MVDYGVRAMKRVWLPALLSAAATLLPGLAAAHPHVWVTTRSAFAVDASGRTTAIRQAWTFDEMFSAYAVQGLDTDGDGKYSREELQSLAETNVTTMAESDYFTFAEADGAEIALTAGTDYWLDYDGTQLTLHFTLPLEQPLPKTDPLSLEIYDPTYFVDFQLAPQSAASLVGAPSGCMASVQRQSESETPGKTPSDTKLPESYFSGLGNQNYGAQFANRITVRCS
jgi:ABC-type uncharacterized transport system substrate-binding protein